MVEEEGHENDRRRKGLVEEERGISRRDEGSWWKRSRGLVEEKKGNSERIEREDLC